MNSPKLQLNIHAAKPGLLEVPDYLMKLCIEKCSGPSQCDSVKLNSLREKLIRAYYKFGAMEVKRIHASFKGKFEEARKLPMAPKKEEMKEALDKELMKAFTPSWWNELDGNTIQDKLESLVRKAAELDVLPGDKGKDALLAMTKEIQEWYHQLTTYANFAFAPIQVKDMDILRIQFKQGENKLNGSPYEFYTSGGWKMDFSAGLAASGLVSQEYYYSGIRQETVDVLNADSTTSPLSRSFGTVKKRGNGNYDWSAAVLAHAYPRTGRVPALGITTGVLIRPENVRWLFGGSLMLGHRNRLVLSGGCSLGSVQVLADGIELDKETELSPSQLSDGPAMRSKMDRSWFASITFNFGGVQLTR